MEKVYLSKEKIINNLTNYMCQNFDNIEFFFEEYLGCIPNSNSPCTIPVLHKLLKFMGENEVKRFLIEYLTNYLSHQEIIDIADDYNCNGNEKYFEYYE